MDQDTGGRAAPEWLVPYARALRSLRHPTYQQVHTAASKGEPPSTTWRRLESLVHAGLVMRTAVAVDSGRRGRVRVGYELREDRHCHITCKRCGLMVDGPSLRYEAHDLLQELRARVAKMKGLAVDFQIDLTILCALCQKPNERTLAREGEGITKQLALERMLKDVPPRFHWERPRAASLRARALKVFDGLPRTDDAGTMDRQRLPWDLFPLHANCKYCRHFEPALA